MKKKVKKIIEKIDFKKYISTNVLFLSYVVLSFLIGYILRVSTIGNFFEIKPIILDLSVIIIVGAFGYLIKPKNQFKYFLACCIIFAILSTINSIYYGFFSSFITINLLSTLGQVGDVNDSIFDRLKIINFVFLIFPLILILVHNKLTKNKYYFEVEKVEKGKNMFFKTTLVGILSVILITITLSGLEISRFVKQWNREFIVQRFGIYTYSVNDLVQAVRPKINTLFGYEASTRKFKKFYTENKKVKDLNKFTDLYKNKNVIFIHAESIQTFLIDLKINGVEVTPNLNKLTKNSLYFNKFYPQISVGTSSDTEFTLSTGLMPSSSGTVFVSYYNREYESLQKHFQKLGYYTFSMHGNKADFWNRKVMHKNLGYKDFFAKDTFEIDDVIGLGLSDKSFFRQAQTKLEKIKEKNKNYMGTLITLTNHSPFNDVEKYGEFNISLPYKELNEAGIEEEKIAPYLENSEMGRYIKSAHYADEALGEFFESVKNNNLDDNTVFVLYGDHEARMNKKEFDLLYNYNPYNNKIKEKTDPTYVNIDNYNFDLLKNTPFFIYYPDKPIKKTISDVMGMYDITDTIGNMFGYTPKYSLGNDVFSNNEKIVVFPNGNVLTNKVYFNSLKDDYVSLSSDPIDSEYIQNLKKYSENRIEVSNSIIIHDLIRKEGKNIK